MATTLRYRVCWKRTGRTPLTLDHLGGLIGQFLGGDPAKAPEAPQFASPEHDRQALRLARLLKAYEEHLPPEELALLSRLCLLERSVQIDQIIPLFLCSPAVHVRTAGELVSELRFLAAASVFPPQTLLELSDSVLGVVTAAVVEHPIAGPDQLFRDNIKQAIAELNEQFAAKGEALVEEVIELYDKTNFEISTELRPLSWHEQQQLLHTIGRYQELQSHPFFPYKEPAPWSGVLIQLGWVKSALYPCRT